MKEQGWHRRQAIQIAGQLPEDRDDALMVIQAMTRLVMLPGFWGVQQTDKPAATIVRIGGNECA